MSSRALLALELEDLLTPRLIILMLVLGGVLVYKAATQTRDEERSADALKAIRRCHACHSVVSPTATTCRHCSAELNAAR